jgi:mannose/fructose-specific phosphotransferase system component IIA
VASIILTHGNFAKGLLNSIKLICDKQENFDYYCAYFGDNGVKLGMAGLNFVL